ncbi:MAG: single-stranded-DNA-specific exonuclease RecJ [Flavobacteriales bacterium]|jgi:single-stranded-DNA-specific exonuclease|nr:single-stranded-DNA-specific exonuclease RecJ [Flavobacteriales bacterium]MBT6650312.1 single-stranded-DNA-specific exonuclease RecJ [Flavobacteriales bacterium]
MEKRWIIQKSDQKFVQKLAKDLGVNHIVAHLLVLRGIENFDDAKLFFRPELKHLHDPFLMKNMQDAVDRIEKAIANKEKVLVYGDYDVDGTTSVAMMYSFLKRFSPEIEYYIPCRYEEGYGISLKGIDYAKKNNFSLIIALDCGIRAFDQVDYANEKEVDFIICDHHNPADKIPNAIAILNPKQSDCNYPYKELSGCGVGFKLIQAYSQKNNIDFSEISEYLDLLTVSIGADIVPMTGENRVFSYFGLKQINTQPRAGLKALMDIANKIKELSISDVVFGIAPRINAAGRIEHAKKAVEILVEQDLDRAKKLASFIEENNVTRRNLDQNITKEALEMIDENKKSTVVFSKNWHKGVVGIVASRVIESHYKPTIVLAEKDGILTGSARSVHDFDLYEAISKCAHLCEKFGGHKYAAGLSIKKENLSEFIIAFEKAVSESITEDQLSPKIDVDMEIDIDAVDDKLFRIIKQFSPFGPQNLSPIFVSRSVVDNGYGKRIGADKSHLRINTKTASGSLAGIGFSMGDAFEKIKDYNEFDICYSINENEWNGRKNLQLMLNDLKVNS